jgi:hypothetical protein
MTATRPTDRDPSAPSDMTVAKEIARQIGGLAFRMMGTTTKVGDATSLLFDVRGSRTANKVRVTLEASDTYTVTSYKVGRAPACDFKVVAEASDVYDDNLRDVIEAQTGLYLHF